jgi:hypothetical protein
MSLSDTFWEESHHFFQVAQSAVNRQVPVAQSVIEQTSPGAVQMAFKQTHPRAGQAAVEQPRHMKRWAK